MDISMATVRQQIVAGEKSGGTITVKPQSMVFFHMTYNKTMAEYCESTNNILLLRSRVESHLDMASEPKPHEFVYGDVKLAYSGLLDLGEEVKHLMRVDAALAVLVQNLTQLNAPELANLLKLDSAGPLL